MATEFGTDAWIKELHRRLNESELYREAAANWEGDFHFVITKGEGIEEERYLYIDLQHGQSLDAFRDLEKERNPAYTLSGPLPLWRKIVTGQLDPIKALMSRQLKLRGNMMKIMKSPKAAVEMVKVCTEIDTAWPETT